MDAKRTVRKLIKITDDMEAIEKGVVYAYLELLSIPYYGSGFFCEYFSSMNEPLTEQIRLVLKSEQIGHCIEYLVEIFEQLVPSDHRKGNGVVYTPSNIKNYIIKSVITSKTVPTVCDPACGCGSFLVSAAEYIHNKYNITYSTLVKDHIYGIDIDPDAIRKTKLLLNILACEAGEILDCKFENILCADSLHKPTLNNFREKVGAGFDCVIGNPPYVRSRNMNSATKQNLIFWETAKSGNVDLYIPFYEIGIELLNASGKLGFISTNTFLQSVNGRSLRRYLKASTYDVTILDFRETQVFSGVTSYTCITIIDKLMSSGVLNYALLNGKSSLSDYSFTKYYFDEFDDGTPWRLCREQTDIILRNIEAVGKSLSAYKIRNGLATLKNEVFFFAPVGEYRDCFIREYNGKLWMIEKKICIDVVKPNILKSEADLSTKLEKALFPYQFCDGQYRVISEESLETSYPQAYAFLLSVKDVLAKRDKGNGKYPAWYAYGRMQGVNNTGKKLLIPYIAGQPTAIISTDENLLFYCGYALFSDDEQDLRVLKCFLSSAVFWYYILHTSKPYSKGYMALSKNYIKSFSIPKLSSEQIAYVLSQPNDVELNNWLWKLYGVETPPII